MIVTEVGILDGKLLLLLLIFNVQKIFDKTMHKYLLNCDYDVIAIISCNPKVEKVPEGKKKNEITLYYTCRHMCSIFF